MKVTIHEEWQSFVIKTSGRFEDGDCQLLKEVLEKGTQGQHRPVLVDLQDLQNITTAGQRMLLSYSGQLAALHRPFILYSVNQPVMKAFESSGLAQVINIASGLKEAQALAQFRKVKL
jgi:anti-anti-sigma factor